MKKGNIRKTVMAGVVTTALVIGGASFAFAEPLFGGDWYHGTNYLNGTASSSYYHGSASHWTSIGTSSGKYARAEAQRGRTARTSLWRSPGASATFKAGVKGKTAIRH